MSRETEIHRNHKWHLSFHCSLRWATVKEPQLRASTSSPPNMWSLFFGLTDGIGQGEYKRWTELGRGCEFFRGILEVLCCFVFEMFLFLWEKGRSAFLFPSTCRVTSRVNYMEIYPEDCWISPVRETPPQPFWTVCSRAHWGNSVNDAAQADDNAEPTAELL